MSEANDVERLVSGLEISTLKKYSHSDLLERVPETGEPIYMHSSKCMNYCDYACNGNHGTAIAEDIGIIEGYSY